MADLRSLETALANADRAGDTAAARQFAEEIQRATRVAPAPVAVPSPPADGGGFIPGLKSGALSGIGAVGQVLEDVTGQPSALSEYADERMPDLAFTSPRAIVDRPLTVGTELIAGQAVPLAESLTGAAIGRAAGRAAGAIPALARVPVETREIVGERIGAFGPSFVRQYGEVRDRQEQEGADSIPKALLSAAGGAALEQLGLEQAARGAVFGRGRGAATRLRGALQGAAIQAPVEALTEGGQTVVQRLGAGQDLSSPEAAQDVAMGLIGGAVGGGAIGAGIGAVQRPTPPEPEPEANKTPPPPEPTDEDIERALLDEQVIGDVESPEPPPIEAPVNRPAEQLFDTEIDAETYRLANSLEGYEPFPVNGGFALMPVSADIEVAAPVVQDESPVDFEADVADQQQGIIRGFTDESGNRAPFKTRTQAAAYRLNIGGTAEYDVERQDGNWQLRRKQDAITQGQKPESRVEQYLAPDARGDAAEAGGQGGLAESAQVQAQQAEASLADAAPPEVPAVEAPAERSGPTPSDRLSQIEDQGRRDVRRVIREIGGIELTEAADVLGENRRTSVRRAPWAFRRAGVPMDRVADALYEAGYITETERADVDGGMERARELVRDTVNREPVISVEAMNDYAALKAEVDLDAREAREIVGQDENDLFAITDVGLNPESKEDVLDYDLIARIGDVDEAAVEDASRQFGNDDAAFMQWAQEWVNAREQSAEDGAGSQVGAGAQGASQPASQPGQPQETGGQLRDGTEDFQLGQESPAGPVPLAAADRPENFQLAPQVMSEEVSADAERRDAIARQQPMFSQSAEGSATVEAIRQRAIADLGPGIESLEAQGILRIVNSTDLPENLRAAIGPKTDGLFDPDTATGYVLADRASPDRVAAIIRHEIAEHFGLPGMLGAPRLGKVLNEVRGLIRTSKSKEFQAAVEHVRTSYSLDESSNQFAREVIARYAENPGSDSWWTRLVGEIRDFLNRMGITKISPADLQFLVQKSLRRAMSGELKYLSPEGETSVPSESKMRDVTENENFRRWFGDSKVVDADGRPLVVYHGTSASFNSFEPSRLGEFGAGVYLTTSPNEASAYAPTNERGGNAGHNIMPLYVAMKNPLVLSRPEQLYEIVAPSTGDKFIPSRLMEMGYDGIQFERPVNSWVDGVGAHPTGEMQTHYVAFRPEQIKSIFNRGTFDPTTSNIMESRGADPELPKAGDWDRFIARFQNKFNRWDKLEAHLEAKTGKKLDFTQRVTEKEKVRYGKQQNDAIRVKKEFLDPIEKTLRAGNHSVDRFDKFNIARHAEERNREIRKIDPTNDAGSGMTDAAAQEYLKDLTPAERRDFTKAGDLLVNMNRWMLDLRAEAGTITPEERTFLQDRYQFYVPLKSVRDPEEVSETPGTVGYTIRGKEFKRALGRSTEASSPYIVSIIDSERAISRARVAEVGKAVWELANNPDAKGILNRLDPETIAEEFRIKRVYKKPVLDADGKPVREVIERDGKRISRVKTKEVVDYGIDPTYATNQGVLALMIDGERQYVQVKDPLLAQQFKGLGETQLGAVLEAMNGATGLLGRMFTQLNPAFVPINFMRDLLTVTINSTAIPGVNAGKVFRGVSGTMPAIYSHIFGDGTHPKAAIYKEFLEQGATTGGLGLRTFEQQTKLAKERGLTLKAGEKAPVRRAVGQMKQALDFVADANEIVENATRLSVYIEAKQVFAQQNRDAGMNETDAVADAKQRAAVLAREISVDFNKRGEYSRALASFFVFFNAAVQGLASAAKFTKNSPGSHRVQQALFGLVVFGFAARMLNHFANGFDDELAEEEALAFDQQAKLAVPIQVGDKLIKFQLPYIYNLPAMLGYRVADMMVTGRVGHNVGELVKTFIGSISPLGEPVQADTPIGFAAKTAFPSLLRPFADMLDNTNSFGGPLAKKPSLWDKAPPPRAYDSWSTTGEVGKAIAKLLNAASGGDEVEPGAIDISPEYINHLLSFYFAGPGRFVKQTYSAVNAIASDEFADVPQSQYPIVGRIFSEAKPRWYVSGQYREIEKEAGYVEERIKAGKPVEPWERRYAQATESADKQLRDQYRLLNQAREREDKAREDQIQERIDGIKARVVRVYNMGTGRYEEAMAGANRRDVAQAAQMAGKPETARLLMEMER